MPKRSPRARSRRSLPKEAVHDRLARVLETAPLARVVPHLPPETLHALIRLRGLDAAGDLVAAATPAQLTAIFDIDLWRRSQSGRDDRFDADRFGDWLEALVDSDDVLAARTVAALDEQLVITGLSRYVRVFDPAVLDVPIGDDEAIDGVGPSFAGLSRELGGYVVRAKRTDAWDAIVAMLGALEEHHPHRFHIVMGGCRRLSNSKPEIDGLDDLLMEPAQVLHDVAAERDDRRSQQGYVTPADARAFLQMARQRQGAPGAGWSANPIVAAYFRAADEGAQAVDDHREPPATGMERPDEDDRESLDAVVALLDEAGLLPGRPRALLVGDTAESTGPARVEALLRELGDDAFAARSRELAFLANVLMAGASVLSRAFTPQEASEAAIAICNLGLEHWPFPEPFCAHHDLVAAFEAGWAVLHELGMFVAAQLLEALRNLQSVDAEIQEGLRTLRRELVRQCEDGTPWRARGALEIIAMIDVPVCVGLQALFDECPVLSDAVTAILERRTGAISPTAFEFISTARQIQTVRQFAGTLLEVLMR